MLDRQRQPGYCLDSKAGTAAPRPVLRSAGQSVGSSSVHDSKLSLARCLGRWLRPAAQFTGLSHKAGSPKREWTRSDKRTATTRHNTSDRLGSPCAGSTPGSPCPWPEASPGARLCWPVSSSWTATNRGITSASSLDRTCPTVTPLDPWLQAIRPRTRRTTGLGIQWGLLYVRFGVRLLWRP
jgi:hypothetical protein